MLLGMTNYYENLTYNVGITVAQRKEVISKDSNTIHKKAWENFNGL